MAAGKKCQNEECPFGCCPYPNWAYCCWDSLTCAPTAADCPNIPLNEKLIKKSVEKECDSDTWECPAGCCPEIDWTVCCPDNMYCAPTLDACPSVARNKKLVKMAAKTQCDAGECPMCCLDECCPVEGHTVCCPGNMYCALTLDSCPSVARNAKLVQMAAKKQCTGTDCPFGCCPEPDWYCCPDMWCAATSAVCPFVSEI